MPPRRRLGQEELFPSRLYYGDNLHILRNKKYIPDASVDLIYLDPPFKPTESYNVLFHTRDGNLPAAAQVRAFEDTWRWDEAAAEALHDAMENAPEHVGRVLKALRSILGESDMFAYMCMMAPRLVELHNVLRPTGTIYLHCDPAASHYLKVLMDSVFGPYNFRNEIVWRRTNARKATQRWPRVHDTLLFYGKSPVSTFNPPVAKADVTKMPHTLITGPDGLKYQTYELTGAGTRRGETGQPWSGFDPNTMGRHWAQFPKTMDEWDAQGLIHWPQEEGFPRRRAAEPFDGTKRQVAVGDMWTDIDRINQTAKERLGYPTQKPEALLKRIITASTNRGDVVLDPFCGCGTAIEVAERQERTWIGIDIAEAAISVIQGRLDKAFGRGVRSKYSVWGEPASLEDARTLAGTDPYQFQWWAVRRLGAREVERRKGADKGVDGRLILRTSIPGYDGFPEAIIQVKAGRAGPEHVRGLIGTLNNEDAPIGVLVTLNEPTPAMRGAAASAGFCAGSSRVPRIQMMTAKDILDRKQVEVPNETEAARVRPKQTRVARRASAPSHART